MECLVCLAPTICKHYRALTCRACSAFFRRTNRGNLQYLCARNKNCDVRKGNRMACRFCRLKKCLAIGMIYDKDDGLANFVEEEEPSVSELETEALPDDKFFSLDNIFGNNEQFLCDYKDRIKNILSKIPVENPAENSICDQFSAAYKDLRQKWPNCKKTTLIEQRKVHFDKILCYYFKFMEQSAEFCMQIGAFQELPIDQKGFVLKHFLLRFPAMFNSFSTVEFLGNDVNDRRMVVATGQVVDYWSEDFIISETSEIPEIALRAIQSTQQLLQDIVMKPYKRLHADEFERVYLIAYMMWSIEEANGVSNETLEKAREIRESLVSELQTYYSSKNENHNYSSRVYKIQNLVRSFDKLAERRIVDHRFYNLFQIFKIQMTIWEKCDFNETV